MTPRTMLRYPTPHIPTAAATVNRGEGNKQSL